VRRLVVGLVVISLISFGLARGGLDLAVSRSLASGSYAGRLGFYFEGRPLAVRGDLILGEGGGLLGGVDLLWRPLGDFFAEPYLGFGVSTVIARNDPASGWTMDVGAASYAVATLGLALRFGGFRPYADFSYSYGASPYGRVSVGIVWPW